MPPILTQVLLNLIEAETLVDVVELVDGRADLEQEVARHHADVVITRAAEAGASDRWTALLFRHPQLRLLALSHDARTAFLHRLVPECTVYTDVSPQQLLEAIRGGTGDPA